MIIDEFEIVEQKRDDTCGYASAAMIINYLTEKEVDEDFLVANEPIGEEGITFYKLEEIYDKYLSDYEPEIVYEEQEQTFQLIKESLRQELPLHILYLTEDELGDSGEVLHYAVLIGYKEAEDTFVLADPFGRKKEIAREEYFERVSFSQASLPEEVRDKMPSNLLIKFN